jgi:cytochrome c oxidase cbb3-type subunit 3
MIPIKNKFSFGRAALLVGLLNFAIPAMSQAENTPAVANGVSNTSLVWWMVIAAMAVLLLAIAVLGNVLVILAKMSLKKSKGIAVILLAIVSFSASAQEPAAAEAAKTTTSVFGDINVILAATVLLAEFVVIVILVNKILRFVEFLSEEKEAPKTVAFQIPNLLDKFNASVAIEKETDILLDHDYDGIKELDNNLPPWWKYGFYFTIVWAFVYFGYYHVFGGPSSEDEYNAAMEQGKAEVEAYLKNAAMNVDENTVTLADASGIKDGKSIFESNCATCHGKLGEGNAGPNLTDDYWLHGGSINDVFKTVKYGVVAKGMKSWQGELSPVDIRNVVSYVKTLHGTNPPNAKAPEGEIYHENAAAGAAAKVDSTDTATK